MKNAATYDDLYELSKKMGVGKRYAPKYLPYSLGAYSTNHSTIYLHDSDGSSVLCIRFNEFNEVKYYLLDDDSKEGSSHIMNNIRSMGIYSSKLSFYLGILACIVGYYNEECSISEY